MDEGAPFVRTGLADEGAPFASAVLDCFADARNDDGEVSSQLSMAPTRHPHRMKPARH
jgi:hypothetical protein